MIVFNFIITGLLFGHTDQSTISGNCVSCLTGKMPAASFPAVGNRRTTQPLEIIHADVTGPMHVSTWGGARYLLTFTDHCTRMTWGYLMKHKSEVSENRFSILNRRTRDQRHAADFNKMLNSLVKTNEKRLDAIKKLSKLQATEIYPTLDEMENLEKVLRSGGESSLEKLLLIKNGMDSPENTKIARLGGEGKDDLEVLMGGQMISKKSMGENNSKNDEKPEMTLRASEAMANLEKGMLTGAIVDNLKIVNGEVDLDKALRISGGKSDSDESDEDNKNVIYLVIPEPEKPVVHSEKPTTPPSTPTPLPLTAKPKPPQSVLPTNGTQTIKFKNSRASVVKSISKEGLDSLRVSIERSCKSRERKKCQNACKAAVSSACEDYSCKKKLRNRLKKRCKKECKNEFSGKW